MDFRLKPEYIQAIVNDGLLYGKIANAVGVTGPSLAMTLRKNGPVFTTKKILKIIGDHLRISEDELTEVIPETETA